MALMLNSDPRQGFHYNCIFAYIGYLTQTVILYMNDLSMLGSALQESLGEGRFMFQSKSKVLSYNAMFVVCSSSVLHMYARIGLI